MSNVNDFVGRELGLSSWMTVDQARINQFADCTGDRQWIHVDVDRAKRESPFGSAVAHGYLTLALIAPLAMEIGVVPKDAAAGFNYGLDKARFLAPVRAGARVRLRVDLLGVEPKEAGQLVIKTKNTLEIDGSDKPALIAETLALLVPGKASGAGEHR
jgi:acyl dehydratase